MGELVYLELESSGWLYVGVVRFFNFGIHAPTLFLLASITFVLLRARKILINRKKELNITKNWQEATF